MKNILQTGDKEGKNIYHMGGEVKMDLGVTGKWGENYLSGQYRKNAAANRFINFITEKIIMRKIQPFPCTL